MVNRCDGVTRAVVVSADNRSQRFRCSGETFLSLAAGVAYLKGQVQRQPPLVRRFDDGGNAFSHEAGGQLGSRARRKSVLTPSGDVRL